MKTLLDVAVFGLVPVPSPTAPDASSRSADLDARPPAALKHVRVRAARNNPQAAKVIRAQRVGASQRRWKRAVAASLLCGGCLAVIMTL
jgi:hypothetical protein